MTGHHMLSLPARPHEKRRNRRPGGNAKYIICRKGGIAFAFSACIISRMLIKIRNLMIPLIASDQDDEVSPRCAERSVNVPRKVCTSVPVS